MEDATSNIVTPFWAEEACRLVEAARAAPWADSAEAAMVAAAAHNARWLATVASDPSASAQRTHIQQLSQAASDSLERVRWVQRVAAMEAGGCPGDASRESLEMGVPSATVSEWERRVAAAGAMARHLANVNRITLPLSENHLVQEIDFCRTNVFGELPPSPWGFQEDLETLSNRSDTTVTSSVSMTSTLVDQNEHMAPEGNSEVDALESSSTVAPSEVAAPVAVAPIPSTGAVGPGAGASKKTPSSKRIGRGAERRRRTSSRRQQRCLLDTVRIVLGRVTKVRTLAAAAAFLLAFLLLLTNSPGVSPIASWGHSQLALDLEAFQSLLTVPRVKSIVYRTMRTDPDVHRALKYLGTARFRRRCLIIEAMPEVQQLSQLLAADGVGLRTTLRAFNEQLELTYSRIKARKTKRKSKPEDDDEEDVPRGSLKALFEELQNALPAKQIQGLYELKMKESEPFKRFIAYVAGPEGEAIARKLRLTKEYVELVRTLRSRQLTEKQIIQYVRWLFVGGSEDSTALEMPATEPGIDTESQYSTVGKQKRGISIYT